ncbi:transcriptional regulator [Vibrio ishigakensis]|uniref:Transcriptional regulator n=1 Tax=Vibrio ishigakensis TaxID=1481914 RepID=A0A0B8Q9Y5_9VIBR|nr:transcriptional regulator [Vibrio ishigakensis]
MSTITDVSVMANVSKATVSRVFSGNAKVKEETRISVLNAARALGYNPEQTSALISERASSASATSTRQGTLGIIVSQMSSQSFGQFFNTAQQYAQAQDVELQLFNSCNNAFQEKSYLAMLVASGCETIVLVESNLKTSDINEFSFLNSKLVTFSAKEELSQLNMGYDHAGACTSACNFLMAHKHSDIALISGTGTNSVSYIEGFKHGHERRSMPFNSQLIIDNIEDGAVAATELCSHLGDFSAVITATDKMAAELMATLRQFGYEIPKDISVISLEGSELAQYTFPRLTALEMPLTSMAQEMIDLCTKQDTAQPITNLKRLTGKLVVRESVAKFRPANTLDPDNLPLTLSKNL